MQVACRSVFKKVLDNETVFRTIEEKFGARGRRFQNVLRLNGLKSVNGRRFLQGYCSVDGKFTVELKNDKTVLVSDVSINPSFMFWFFGIAGFFILCGLGWIIPLLGYGLHKKKAKEAIETGLRELGEELA
jgi:hypothetical protein